MRNLGRHAPAARGARRLTVDLAQRGDPSL